MLRTCQRTAAGYNKRDKRAGRGKLPDRSRQSCIKGYLYAILLQSLRRSDTIRSGSPMELAGFCSEKLASWQGGILMTWLSIVTVMVLVSLPNNQRAAHHRSNLQHQLRLRVQTPSSLGHAFTSTANKTIIPKYKTTVAFIVPLAPRHFELAFQNILPYFEMNWQPEVSLMLVFTTEGEMNDFFHHYQPLNASFMKHAEDYSLLKYPGIDYAVLNDGFNEYPEGFSNMVTLKKWFGIYAQRRKQPRDFYLTVDAEIAFVKNIDEAFFERLRNRRAIFGLGDWGIGCYEGIHGVVKDFFHTVLQPSADEMEYFFSKATYFWFTDIPLYREVDMDDFFLKINWSLSKEFAASINNFWIFDYLVYGIYMVIYKDWDVVRPKDFGIDVPSLCAMEDGGTTVDILRRILPIYAPLWVNAAAYDNILRSLSPGADLINNFYMIYHLDRRNR